MTPRDKLSGVAVCIWVSRFWVEPWPKLDLGVFRVCFHQLWRLLESLCSNLVIALVRPHRPPTPGTVARSLSTSWRRRSSWFFVVIVTARGSIDQGRIDILVPYILDVAPRDTAVYLIVIFISQSILRVFVLVAPVGDIRRTF